MNAQADCLQSKISKIIKATEGPPVSNDKNLLSNVGMQAQSCPGTDPMRLRAKLMHTKGT